MDIVSHDMLFDLQRHAASKTQSRWRICRTSHRCCWVSTSVHYTPAKGPGKPDVTLFDGLQRSLHMKTSHKFVKQKVHCHLLLSIKVWETFTSAAIPPLCELWEDRAAVLSHNYWLHTHGEAAVWHVQKLRHKLTQEDRKAKWHLLGKRHKPTLKQHVFW